MMRKVIFLNGSPKKRRAVTEKFINITKDSFSGRVESETVYIYETEPEDELFEKVYEADAVVMAQPLYVDCLPAGVLEFMKAYGEFVKDRRPSGTEMYFIINCGFLENRQNDTAIRILEIFAEKTGFDFRGGVSVGSGAIILTTNKKLRLEGMLKELADELGRSDAFEDKGEKRIRQIDAAMPRFLFKAKADKAWIEAGAKKGLSKKDLKQKYFEQTAL
ncbi:MAG: hypothetical protein Q4C14_00490 [Bacillota bacterium]|nr:hypothetical protein [Bacillota bacterium]